MNTNTNKNIISLKYLYIIVIDSLYVESALPISAFFYRHAHYQKKESFSDTKFVF